MAAAAILNCYLVTLDHPRSLLHGPNIVLKFHVNRFTIFRDMAIWKFCKFGLKRLFPPPKFTFLRVLTPKHYFSSSRPPKGTSLAETASYEPLSVAIGRGVSSGRRANNTKKRTKGSPDEVTNWVLAPPTPLIRSYFDGEFSCCMLKNKLTSRSRPTPIYIKKSHFKMHFRYTSLLCTVQPSCDFERENSLPVGVFCKDILQQEENFLTGENLGWAVTSPSPATTLLAVNYSLRAGLRQNWGLIMSLPRKGLLSAEHST